MNDSRPGRRPQRSDFEQALRSMDTYIDITVDDLMALTRRAEQIAERHHTEGISVSQIMTQPVQSVRPSTPLHEAAHRMVSGRISGLPVVDEAGRLSGIITEADFLRALGIPSSQPNHTLWQTLETLFTHLRHHGALEAPDDPVSSHMASHVVCVGPEADLHDVLQAMRQHRVKRLVVCDRERKVLGMVTRSDLVRLFFDNYTKPTNAAD